VSSSPAVDRSFLGWLDWTHDFYDAWWLIGKIQILDLAEAYSNKARFLRSIVLNMKHPMQGKCLTTSQFGRRKHMEDYSFDQIERS
jgi:hypothetical protein